MTIDLNELERLLAAATAGDLTTAQRYTPSGYVECPMCGDGEVLATDYCNFDGVAMGVQFYGIGKEFGAHEKLWTAVTKTLPTLIATARRVEVLEQENARLRDVLDEDDLTEIITDTIDMDWQPRWAAQAIRRAALGEPQ